MERFNADTIDLSFNKFQDFDYWLKQEPDNSIYRWNELVAVKKKLNQMIFFLDEKKEVPAENLSVSLSKKIKIDGNQCILIEPVASEKVKFDPGNDIEYLDGEKVSFPLTLRKWKPGDRFQPLGMRGQKLVSDFLTDRKLDQEQKNNTYVLLNGNEIMAVISQQINEKYKVKSDSDKIFRLIIKMES